MKFDSLESLGPEDPEWNEDRALSLEMHGLSQVGGTRPVQSARLILLSDRSHAAAQRVIGEGIEEARDPEDFVLVEGDISVAMRNYGLVQREGVKSFENPALYAFALLVVGWAVRAANSGQGIHQRSFERVVVETRNRIMLLRAVRAMNESTGCVYLIAGSSHFNESFQNLLEECGIGYALVEPDDASTDGTSAQNEAYDQALADMDPAVLRPRWQAGKLALKAELDTADALIRLLKGSDQHE